jgi:hypothetical protein
MEYISMTYKKSDPTALTDRALEMVMRDVIDSMSEYSLESGFQPYDGGFDIIEIYPPHRENLTQKSHQTENVDLEDSEVIEFPGLRRAAG